MHRVATGLAVLTLLVLPAAASAKGQSCPKTAKVASGAVVDLAKGSVGADGRYTLEGAEPAKKLERGAHTYLVTEKAAIVSGGARFTLAKDSVVGLSCFGRTKAEGAIFPAVALESGSSTVAAKAGRPGAIITSEAMSDPFASKRMKITATRVAAGDPSVAEILETGPEILAFGTTEVEQRSARKSGYVNFTPEVGPRRGTCRQAHAGTFTSTSRDAKGYMRGTAEYRGYAPGSPR